MTSWPKVNLSQVTLRIRNGLSIKQSADAGGLPISRIETISGSFVDADKVGFADLPDCSNSGWLLENGDILFSHINSETHIGKCAIYSGSPPKLIHGMNLLCLKANPDVISPEYLSLAIRCDYFRKQLKPIIKRAVNQASVSIGNLQQLKVPLPTPSEQRRIVEILNQADQLRKLRAETDKKAERILPALFNKMFGDPVTNPMRWDEMALRQVIAKVEAGWSAVSEARLCNENEHGVLKVSAVTSGRFLASEHKAVPELQPERELIAPRRGDLLFSRANTRELVAASCVVEEDHPNLFLPDKLWRLTPRAKRATSMYLKELFWNNGFRDRFRASASGSSGSMLNISQEAMLNTIAPIPPFDLQETFSAKAWGLAILARQRRATKQSLDSLWANLLQRAFSGTLTASWREAHMKELLAEMEQQAKYLN